jgi:hypothetical protein
MPNLYLNLEDDVSTIVEKLKKLHATSLVLVCPKRCFLFRDGINLRLLKKQADLLGKEIFILTMDEKGQAYAKEAGFQLKFLYQEQGKRTLSDIRPGKRVQPSQGLSKPAAQHIGILTQTGKDISGIVRRFTRGSRQERVATAGEFRAAENLAGPQLLVADSVYPPELQQAYELTRHKRKNQKRVAVLAAGSLLIILVVFFVILPKATVIVYPKTEPVTRDMEISLGTNIQTPDVDRLVMPAKKFSEPVELKNTFQSQGKKEIGNKAGGTVKIYNFAKLPINLKSSTTILSVGSKTYRLTQDVSSLRPATYKNAKTKEINEDSLGPSFGVVAADGGESFNLPAGTRMEISNQVFGSNPQFLYAKTDTAITGGTSRFLSVVSDQDIKDSQSALSVASLETVKNKLAKENLTLADKSYVIQTTSFFTDKPVNSESPTFQASFNATISGLAFDKDQLLKLAMDRISQTLAGDKILQFEDLEQMDYKIKTVDPSGETAVLLVHFEGKAVMKLDLKGLAAGLAGKSKSQVNEILKSRPEIEKIDIILAPAWQQNFPWFSQKISVIKGGS